MLKIRRVLLCAQRHLRHYYAIMLFIILSCLISGALMFLASWMVFIQSLDYWTADWRTALLTRGLDRQHDSIALVIIDEETLERFGSEYRSPTDRALISSLLKSIDPARPKVIGLDFFFDQKTKDDPIFVATVRQANSPIVLGEAVPPIKLTPKQSAFQATFLQEIGRPFGYVNIATSRDDVVRFQGEPTVEHVGTLSFAEQLVASTGKQVQHQHRRISWPGSLLGDDAFATVPAWVLLPNLNEKPDVRLRGLDLLRGRSVIIGLDLHAQRDNHWTPVSKLTGEPMIGARVQAYLAAQIMDGNEYTNLGTGGIFLLAALIGFTSMLVKHFLSGGHWILNNSPIAAYILLDIIAYMQFNLVMPFAIVALSWLIGLCVAALLKFPSTRSASFTM